MGGFQLTRPYQIGQIEAGGGAPHHCEHREITSHARQNGGNFRHHFFFCFLGEGRSSRSRKRTDGAGEGGDGGAAVEQEGRREHRGDEQRQHRVPRPPLPPPPPPPRGRGCRRRRLHGRHRSDHPPPVDRLRQAAAPEVAARRSVSLDRWRGEEEAVAAFYSKRCKLEIASSVFSFFFPKKKNKDNGNNNRKNRLQKKYNRKKTQLNG